LSVGNHLQYYSCGLVCATNYATICNGGVLRFLWNIN